MKKQAKTFFHFTIAASLLLNSAFHVKLALGGIEQKHAFTQENISTYYSLLTQIPINIVSGLIGAENCGLPGMGAAKKAPQPKDSHTSSSNSSDFAITNTMFSTSLQATGGALWDGVFCGSSVIGCESSDRAPPGNQRAWFCVILLLLLMFFNSVRRGSLPYSIVLKVVEYSPIRFSESGFLFIRSHVSGEKPAEEAGYQKIRR
ncbi:MAG: hypothetical protein JW803_02485 [Endomicrobiales bacterium]|nr:hypothetical protein [Endomicrobiales bacterium]